MLSVSLGEKPLAKPVHQGIIKDMEEMARDSHVLIRKISLLREKIKNKDYDFQRFILKGEDIFITALSHKDRWSKIMSRVDSLCKE